MTNDRDRVLSDFIDAWNAGRRPDVDDYLARVDDAEQGELLQDITNFVTWGPTPDYDERTLDDIRREPIVAEALAAMEQRSGLWPALLPRLRARLGLGIPQVAREMAQMLELPQDREAKTERYLAEMEQGRLDPSGVSSRVLEALARLLRVPTDELSGAGDLGGWGTPVAAPMFRATPAAAKAMREDLEVFADAVAAPGGEDWDEVDELFRGGR